VKEIIFSPAEIEISGEKIKNPFKGSMTLSLMKYKERIEYIQKMDVGDGKESSAAGKMIDLVYERCTKVDLVYEPTNTQYTNLDDLGYSVEGSSLINEAGKALIAGYKLGNS